MKKLLYILFFLAIVGAGVGYYFFNQKTDLATQDKSIASLSAKAFLSEFIKDETAANAKYLNQTVTIEGNVINATEEEGNKVLVELEGNDGLESITCNFDASTFLNKSIPKEGDFIKLKGKCTGYTFEELLELKTVTLVQCLQVD